MPDQSWLPIRDAQDAAIFCADLIPPFLSMIGWVHAVRCFRVSGILMRQVTRRGLSWRCVDRIQDRIRAQWLCDVHWFSKIPSRLAVCSSSDLPTAIRPIGQTAAGASSSSAAMRTIRLTSALASCQPSDAEALQGHPYAGQTRAAPPAFRRSALARHPDIDQRRYLHHRVSRSTIAGALAKAADRKNRYPQDIYRLSCSSGNVLA